MIKRYSRKAMSDIWTDQYKYETWLKVEIYACEALANIGRIPKKAVTHIKRNAAFSVERIEEIETEIKHDVIAFLTNVAEHVGPDSRYIHMGLTSSDVLDTSFAHQLQKAGQLILKDIDKLMTVLKKKAFKYKDTVMIGRSHGIHAEPITFGLKLALWHDEMRRNRERLEHAIDSIGFGKISGAVGTFANTPPLVESYVCKKMGLKPAPVSTQVVQRDRHAEFFSVLAIIAATIEKIALEIRHLQRTEVLEAEEYFSKGQRGSSAMPHKRNPVASENLCGLARIIRSNALAAFENVALWHERDISHSSVERVIGPDSTILVDYMLQRITNMLQKLLVYPKNMQANLDKLKGLIFSQQVLVALAEAGITREGAYRLVQNQAMRVWQGKGDFKELLLADADICEHLGREKIKEIFDVSYHLKYISAIFSRVFG